jgi:hypothetical protein
VGWSLEKIPVHRQRLHDFAMSDPTIVIPSMNPNQGLPTQAFFSGRPPAALGVDDRWHGMCILQERIKKCSHFVSDIVNCVNRRAKPGFLSEFGSLRQEISESIWFVIGWIRGAGRIGHRLPSSVRVAFDGAHWPAGNGKFSTHGSHARHVTHARFVVRWESYFPLVFLPACEAVLRQRHLSSSPRLLAAMTSKDVRSALTCPACLASKGVRSLQMSGRVQRAFRATRPFSRSVRSAASFPTMSAGMSGDWKSRTQPQPTHASAFG